MAIEVERTEKQESIAENPRGGDTNTAASGAGETETPRRRPNPLIPLVIVAVVCFGGGRWWLNARNYEDTDDAQVDGHMNPIASRIAGTIQAVHVHDNQHVQAGDPLVDLDPRDYKVALTQAKAGYSQAFASITAERPNLPIAVQGNLTNEATGQALVNSAEAALAAAQHDYDTAVARLRSSEATNVRAQSDLKRYTVAERRGGAVGV
jgi:membrane fusion protein (multidrug efflux system)